MPLNNYTSPINTQNKAVSVLPPPAFNTYSKQTLCFSVPVKYFTPISTLNGVISTLNGVMSTLNGVMSTLNGVMSTLSNVKSTLSNVMSTLSNVMSTLNSVKSASRTPIDALITYNL
jgi:prophage DNA circulation protein